MSPHKIGILHPGEMGISIAVSAQNSGNTLCWVSAGRSAATHARAEQYGLQDMDTLENLCAKCDSIICVCPPHAAEEIGKAISTYWLIYKKGLLYFVWWAFAMKPKKFLGYKLMIFLFRFYRK